MQCPRKMRANFVDLASGMVGLLGLGRTASIVPFLPPFLLPSPNCSRHFRPSLSPSLSLSLPLSPHSTDPEAQKSPSLFLSMAYTRLCQNTRFQVELVGCLTKIIYPSHLLNTGACNLLGSLLVEPSVELRVSSFSLEKAADR